eukprot:1893391-Prymnesium_polylepis.1
MADVVARGGIGSLRAPCGAIGAYGLWPMMRPGAVSGATRAVLTSIAPPSPPSAPPASACGSPLPQSRPSSPA